MAIDDTLDCRSQHEADELPGHRGRKDHEDGNDAANEAHVVHASARGSRATIYVIDAPEHPFDVRSACAGLASAVVRVPIRDWGDALTPWPAPALYRGEAPYGGHAAATLARLLEETIPDIEGRYGFAPDARAICGYSLGGLFALYALTHADAFRACGCLSGSVWYEGWVEHLQDLDHELDGHFAFLSLGTKEKRGARPQMRSVQDRMEACADILRASGCEVRFELGPGSHFQYIRERHAAGLAALDDFLQRS